MIDPTLEQIEERLRHTAKQAHEKQREAERALYEAVDENAALKAKITQWEDWQADDKGLEAAKTQEIRSLRKALNIRREVNASGVNPDWIKDQRASNWPDMHPEDFCHKCGARNPAWAAQPDDWDTATASWAAETGREGICCVTCFVDMHRAETGGYSLWVLKRVGSGARSPEIPDNSPALVAAAGATPQVPSVRAAREFLEAALAESDADEKDPDGGSGWDVEVDARTVLDLLAEAAPLQVDESKLAELVERAERLTQLSAAEGSPIAEFGVSKDIAFVRGVRWTLERLRGGGQ